MAKDTITFDLEDYGLLWHTGHEIKPDDKEELFLNHFEHQRGQKDLNDLKWLHWVGESALTALTAYKILKQNNYKVGLFWDVAPINDDPDCLECWGFVLASDFTK